MECLTSSNLRKKYLECPISEKILYKKAIELSILLEYVLKPKEKKFHESEEKLQKLFITYFLSCEYKDDSEEIRCQKRFDYDEYEKTHSIIEKELSELYKMILKKQKELEDGKITINCSLPN